MVSGLGRETALMQAAEHPGNGTVLEILLKEPDIDINKADKYGQTALMKASYFGRSNAVRLLLRCPKTDVDAAADGVTRRQYVDDLTFSMESTDTGCYVKGHSTSRTW